MGTNGGCGCRDGNVPEQSGGCGGEPAPLPAHAAESMLPAGMIRRGRNIEILSDTWAELGTVPPVRRQTPAIVATPERSSAPVQARNATVWANAPVPVERAMGSKGERPAVQNGPMREVRSTPLARQVNFLPGPQPRQHSTFLGKSAAGGPFGSMTLGELRIVGRTQGEAPWVAVSPSLEGAEPAGMTPQEQDAWHEMLRRMREEEDRLRKEARERDREQATRDEERRVADEASAAKLARLARRTQEEIDYDNALERRAKAQNRSEEDWRVCLRRAQKSHEERLEDAEKTWIDCRDQAAQEATKETAVCALTIGIGPEAVAACVALVIANWAIAKTRCNSAYAAAKDDSRKKLAKGQDDCNEQHIREWRRIQEDNPVPPFPPTHDY